MCPDIGCIVGDENAATAWSLDLNQLALDPCLRQGSDQPLHFTLPSL
jgi:hypothetical protein